jgi:hypothetical protein
MIAEVWNTMENINSNQQGTSINDPVIGNQPITDLLIYIVSEINKFVDT